MPRIIVEQAVVIRPVVVRRPIEREAADVSGCGPEANLFAALGATSGWTDAVSVITPLLNTFGRLVGPLRYRFFGAGRHQ